MGYQLWIADKLREYGLQVVEVNGWQTRGRGDGFAPQAVMAHHTASGRGHDAPALRICTHGRSDLPGPLCNVLLSRSGVAYVVAAGKANHAGSGEILGLDSNYEFLGIEAENDGRGEIWTVVQMDAFHKVSAALLDGIGKTGSHVVGHKEYALPKGRKIDPTFDMGPFRWHVDKILGGEAAKLKPAPKPIEGVSNFRPEQGPTLERGEKGPFVRDWQHKLVTYAGQNIAVDGHFGEGTEAATKAFQKFFGLKDDGVVGPKTGDLMNYLIEVKEAKRPTIKRGDRGDHVSYLQKRIGHIKVDGIFGEKTELRVRKIQRLKGLKIDGIVGPKTWNAIESL